MKGIRVKEGIQMDLTWNENRVSYHISSVIDQNIYLHEGKQVQKLELLAGESREGIFIE